MITNQKIYLPGPFELIKQILFSSLTVNETTISIHLVISFQFELTCYSDNHDDVRLQEVGHLQEGT